MTEDPDDGLTRLIEYLRVDGGLDLTVYKRPSLVRRLEKRMNRLGLSDHDAYVRYLRSQPAEVSELLPALLINVTEFFRDIAAWESLRRRHLPEMLGRRGSSAPIRVWCAGCASGEEVYSLIILLAEILGDEATRQRVIVYGTDLDRHALLAARQATYTETELGPVSRGRRRRFFEPRGRGYRFRADLRSCAVFASHDLVSAPLLRQVDLLACRNTLIYFNAPAQGRILSGFATALRPGGILFLGRAETIRSNPECFDSLDVRARIYSRRQPGDRGEGSCPAGLPPSPRAWAEHSPPSGEAG